MKALVGAIIAGALALSPAAQAKEHVDLLLVLAADTSRSVDEEEHKLQRLGHAKALAHPRVIEAVKSGEYGKIAVAYVEWSGEYEQKAVVTWTIINSESSAQTFAERILKAPRHYWSQTSIAQALYFSAKLIKNAPYTSTRRIIDITGDGMHNGSSNLLAARDDVVAQGITINGLVVRPRVVPGVYHPVESEHTHPPGGLDEYYRNNVIGGPNAFAFAADGFEGFASAIFAKLLAEIAGLLPETQYAMR